MESIVCSLPESTDFDFIKRYDDEATKMEEICDFESAVKNYEYEICYLTKVYRFAISAHNENLQYQTYNGKHFLETAQKWKNDIIEVHKRISDMINEHIELFVNYEPINLDELLKE